MFKETQIFANFRDKTTSFLFFFEYQNLFFPFLGKMHHFNLGVRKKPENPIKPRKSENK
jgi:hypothetical protein